MKHLRKLAILAFAALFAATALGCSLFREKSEEILPHLISEEESESEPVRRAELLTDTKGFSAKTTNEQFDELVDILYNGYRPDFGKAQPVVKQVYEKAMDILNRYVKNDFSDYERVHAMHDWLVYYVKYDFELAENPSAADSNNRSFRLDGALLYNKAVCDGYAKAFALMCGIEQIPCIRVLGRFTGPNGIPENHAWNKVQLNGKWYNLDSTMDAFHLETSSGKYERILNHGYYLLSDADISDSLTGRHEQTGTVPSLVDYPCEESYDFHSQENLGIGSYKMTVTSQNELNGIFEKVKDANGKIGKLELKLDFPEYDKVNLKRPDAYLMQISAAYSKIKDCDYRFDSASGIYPYYRYPQGVFVFLIYK